MGRRPNSLKHLGKPSPLPASPDQASLDRVPNPHPDTDYVAPGRWLLESKSLKLYLGSFRNTAAFHEDCTIGIGKRVAALLKPKWLRIGGYWYPRGGIPIDVFWQAGRLPKGVWLPDPGVSPYRGRA